MPITLTLNTINFTFFNVYTYQPLFEFVLTTYFFVVVKLAHIKLSPSQLLNFKTTLRLTTTTWATKILTSESEAIEQA